MTSPPKDSKNKKSTEKKASLESPEVKWITAQVITVTKQVKSSEDEKSSRDDNSTGGENASFVTQVNMTSSFDTKLENLLTNYFMVIGDQHDIQQVFIQNGIITFDLFTGMCTLQFLWNIQLQKGIDSGDALNVEKMKPVNNVLLYYNFLYCACHQVVMVWLGQFGG